MREAISVGCRCPECYGYSKAFQLEEMEMEDIDLEDDNFDRLSCLKEELDIASLCESGAEFEISDVKKSFDDVEAPEEESDYKFSNDLQLQSEEVQTDSFENLAKDFYGITDDELVMKQIVKSGSGPHVPPGSSVVVHYIAYLEYADEPFDSTRMRKRAFHFDLGDGSVIEGFGIAVASMRKREMSRFLISPDYAFGPSGCPPRVPKNATCLYIIELIDFKMTECEAKPYFNLHVSKRNYAPLTIVLRAFHSVRNSAKEAFNQEHFHKAHKMYLQALKILVDYNKKDEEEENYLKPLLVKLHVNLALCNLKLMYSGRAIHHCNEALMLGDSNVKAHYFKGKALCQLGEFERAYKSLMQAYSLCPGKDEIQSELQKTEQYMWTFSNILLDDKGHTDSPSDKLYQDAIISKLDILLKDKELMELQFPSSKFSQEHMNILEQESARRNLNLRIFKNNSGDEVIHLQKKFT